MHDAAFNCAFSLSLMPEMLEFHLFYPEKIAINIYQCTQIINSIKFSIQIQFGVFLRGHFGTPIDMLRPAVNRQPGFRRRLVEQSNAPKNTFCCKLAAAATWLPTCLVSWLAMRLAAVCRPWWLGSLAGSVYVPLAAADVNCCRLPLAGTG